MRTERRSVLAGTGAKGERCDEGPADRVAFNGPHHLLVGPDGGLYVADTGNNCVRRIDLATRQVQRVVGTGEKGFAGDGGPAREAVFNGVFSIAFHAGALYVCDLGNRRVRRVDLPTGIVETVAGNGSTGVPGTAAWRGRSPSWTRGRWPWTRGATSTSPSGAAMPCGSWTHRGASAPWPGPGRRASPATAGRRCWPA